MHSSANDTAGAHLTKARARLGPHWRRPIAATAVVIAVVAASQMYSAWHAATLISPELDAALREHGRADVEAVLPFPPEKFHLLYLQERGRVVGIEGGLVLMTDVAAPEARRLAGEYWVTELRLSERR